MIDTHELFHGLHNILPEYTEYIAHSTKKPKLTKQTKEYFNDCLNSFPKIDVKYLNKTDVFNVNENNEDCITENQNNLFKTTTKENDSDDGDDDEDESNKYSKLFIIDRSTNNIYQLEFKATNVLVVPVYLKFRSYEQNINDKSVQPRCSTIYENVYNNKARRFNQLLKSFALDRSDNERISLMSNKKPLLKTRAVCPPDPKPKKTISDPVSNLKTSIIYISYKDVDYKIKPGLMTLSSSKQIDCEADKKQEKLLRDLKMELPTNFKNKANIIVNYKGDVLKFSFTISDINCQKLKVMTSVGIMATDESSYNRAFSTISNKTIYIAVPKTSYEYTDNMIKERQKNRTMKFNNVDPIWLVKQRKQRLKEYNQCRKKNPYDDIMELKIGSSIYYESFNCINKVKGGTLSCLVSDKDYESWIRKMAKSDLPDIDENGNDKFDLSAKDNIADWDMVLNSK